MIPMKKRFFFRCLFLSAILCQQLQAQQYYPVDESGFIADSSFHRLIKSKGVQLLSLFLKTEKNGTARYARAFTGNGWTVIDNAGNFIAVHSRNSSGEKSTVVQAPQGYTNTVTQTIPAPKADYNPEKSFVYTTKNGKQGTVSETGKTGIPVEFDYITYIGDNVTRVQKNENYGLYFSNGQMIVAPEYQQIITLSHNKKLRTDLFIVKRHNRFGIIDDKGNVKTPFIYAGISPSLDPEVFGAMDSLKKWKLINHYGTTLSAEYDWIETFYSPGVYKITVGNSYADKKVGLIDFHGHYIAAPVYHDIRRLSTGYSIAITGRVQEKAVVLNNTKGEKIGQDYFIIEDPHNGYSRVITQDSRLYGFIDTLGKIVVKPVYDQTGAKINDKGLLSFRLNDKWGIMNSREKIIIPATYDRATFFETARLIALQKEAYVSLFDFDGKPLFETRNFGALEYIGDGLFLNNLGGKKGIIDKNGNVLVESRYQSINPFNNYFVVKLNDRTGLSDKSGKLIIAPRYDKILDTDAGIGPGIYLVSQNNQTLVVDRYGNELAEPALRSHGN